MGRSIASNANISRYYCIFAVLFSAQAFSQASGQNGTDDVIHYAYAALFGTGVYRLDDRTVVIRAILIEVGKHSDMILLDRNLFEIAVTEISEVKVLKTIFAGEAVYGAD